MTILSGKQNKIALISLGCPKNLVNSEEMAALLQEAGYAFTGAPEEADAVIVNTCAFIESAKSEAIEKLLEIAALREINPGLKLIAAGCLAQRYSREIRTELPEVDAIIGTGSYSEVVSVVESVLSGGRPTVCGSISAPLRELPRAVSTGPAWAYLRIAEGCDNHCAYCVIPSLRGRFRSRTRESILADVMEALFAAVYLDGGWEEAEALVLRALAPELRARPDTSAQDYDYKSLLQIMTQRQGGTTPQYELVEQRGEPHMPTFVMRATLDGREIGRGEGHSKQAAQQMAAQDAYQKLKGSANG